MGAAGTMAVSTDAQATAFSYSSMQVTNMNVLINGVDAADGGGINAIGSGTPTSSSTAINGEGFDTFEFISTSTKTIFNNNTQFGNGGSDIAPGITNVSGTSQNMPLNCQGDCVGNFTDNVYNPVPVLSDFGTYAVADTHMTNTVLNGSAQFGVFAAAKSSFDDNTQKGDTLAGTTMNWNFDTGADDGGKTFQLRWDELRQLETAIDTVGDHAVATQQFSITLEQIDPTGLTRTLFNLTPTSAQISEGDAVVDKKTVDSTLKVDSSTSFAGDLEEADGHAVVSSIVTLAANTSYKLIFNLNASASATSPSVPEPGALALLGAGLLGLGTLRYRRRGKKSIA
jgi:hypothetical protein